MKLNPIVDSRDVRFILFEVLGIDSLTGYQKYNEFDRETFEDVMMYCSDLIDAGHPLEKLIHKF